MIAVLQPESVIRSVGEELSAEFHDGGLVEIDRAEAHEFGERVGFDTAAGLGDALASENDFDGQAEGVEHRCGVAGEGAFAGAGGTVGAGVGVGQGGGEFAEFLERGQVGDVDAEATVIATGDAKRGTVAGEGDGALDVERGLSGGVGRHGATHRRCPWAWGLSLDRGVTWSTCGFSGCR